ncbi:MAG TPA: DUF222 domain-containing protein [Pseudonocardia sp.]|nr:DUF222 domain-containing protein [Pseudonocardia sp.]
MPVSEARDLLGWDRAEARRRVQAAEQVCERIGLDGQVLPARLPATAAAFAAGRAGLRHVDAVAAALASPAAVRLSPGIWAGAEAELADKAACYTPSELRGYAVRLVDQLDQDGPEPDDREPDPVDELYLTPSPDGRGGTLKGRFDDPALYAAIATVIDARSAPLGRDDARGPARRRAEALAEVCGFALDHAPTELLPSGGGRRPHLDVHIRLEELEQRARAAVLDFGGTLTSEGLRLLACDAAVAPIVLGGAGQPLDVGRATRTIPDGLRRAVASRDRRCAFPGCDRPPSWTQIHHILEWERGGDTVLSNLVMLCRTHHRLLHHSGWVVRIRDGLPEFIPPRWVYPEQKPAENPCRTSSPAGSKAVRRNSDSGAWAWGTGLRR